MSDTPKMPLTLFMILLAMVQFGTSMVEYNSGNTIPITVSHFTSNAALIGLIIALNPFFTFIVPPILATKSDRIWTRFGRRSPFILLAAPVLATTLVLTPLMPSFAPLVIVLLIYQFSEDVMTCLYWPLFADIVPANKLGRMGSFWYTWHLLGGIVMSWVAMPLMGKWEPSPYVIAALFTVWTFFFVLTSVREPHQPVSPVKRLSPREYFREILSRANYRHILLVMFLNSMALTCYTSFLALFATQTLGMSKAQLGGALGIGPIISLCLATPLGHLVDRVQKRYILIIGIMLVMFAAAIGFFASKPWHIFTMAIIGGVGIFLFQLPESPFYFEYIPPDRRGTISGALAMIRGGGRMFAFPAVGALAELFGSLRYRVMYPLVFLFAIPLVILLLCMREGPYSGRMKNEG